MIRTDVTIIFERVSMHRFGICMHDKYPQLSKMSANGECACIPDEPLISPIHKGE